jgi:ketosteroid isomerase-like protein
MAHCTTGQTIRLLLIYMYDTHIYMEGFMQAASDLVQRWQDAANRQDIALLLALSDPNIEIIGPRGAAQGRNILAEWVRRAGAHFTIQRIFARADRVVAVQQGIWRSAETGEVIGEAQVASSFRVEQGRIVRVARYDTLEQALDDAGLTGDDEQLVRFHAT